ncbi:MAG: hypothetical protein ACI9HK_003802, partial [Pirellulaceae bacterium]
MLKMGLYEVAGNFVSRAQGRVSLVVPSIQQKNRNGRER